MSDSDLTQSNDAAVFPATADFNTNADPFLVPSDAKKITAFGNAPGQAPVNPSIRRLHALLAGLRGAIIGDFAGAAIKTLKSLKVDGTGGAASTAAAGDIEAVNVRLPSITGLFIGGQGFLDTLLTMGFSGADRLLLSGTRLSWISTASGGSGANPPSTTATKNQLRALNTPKAWVSFTTNGAAGTDCIVSDGHGITGVTRNTTTFTVTFASVFDSAEYAVLTGKTDLPGIWVEITNKLSGSCQVQIRDTTGIKDPVNVDTTRRIDLLFMGRQTT